ncbi:MAG: FtsW/RodA/SpoVE family cell cycle protein [Oscillospiraceae bacterium]|jgi:cell division protein FtsW|nr:FtsW/RodA/SpoVE family cell cycle protein [Oscillospiraceae bacterium]
MSKYNSESSARVLEPGERLGEAVSIDTAAEPSRRGHVDLQFLILTVILLAVGLVMLFSASFANAYYEANDALNVFRAQLGFAVLGVVAIAAVSIIPVSSLKRISLRKLAMPALLISMLLLALTIPAIHFPLAITNNNARRWLGVNGFSFQPSEVAKLGLILGFAHMMCKRGRSLYFGRGRAAQMRSFTRKLGVFTRELAPFALILLLMAGMLLSEPHTSATIIIIAIAAIMLFADGLDIRLIIFIVLTVVLAAVFVIMKAERMFQVSSLALANGEMTLTEFRASFGDYQLKRIVFWLHPEADPQGGGYQILQSLYAVGSGGLLGQGFGQSRQKFFYLPEEHNDYIFAIVCEELGFIGAFLIVVIFALLIIRGFWIAMHARDKFSSLVVIGIMGMLAVQVALNIAVVTNTLPCTGISLPFFSYGGTALLIQLVEMGIVLSVSRDMPIMKGG